MTALRVDGERLLERLHALRRIGATDAGGVTREAFGAADVEARDLVAAWLPPGRRHHRRSTPPPTSSAACPGSVPSWLASGSHLDTVVDGGWLDGAYGVVAAVEVAATLAPRRRSAPRPRSSPPSPTRRAHGAPTA